MLSKLCGSCIVFAYLGSLNSLVLVLGLCFFAGGLRFSEQTFDPSGFDTVVVHPPFDCFSSGKSDPFIVAQY